MNPFAYINPFAKRRQGETTQGETISPPVTVDADLSKKKVEYLKALDNIDNTLLFNGYNNTLLIEARKAAEEYLAAIPITQESEIENVKKIIIALNTKIHQNETNKINERETPRGLAVGGSKRKTKSKTKSKGNSKTRIHKSRAHKSRIHKNRTKRRTHYKKRATHS